MVYISNIFSKNDEHMYFSQVLTYVRLVFTVMVPNHL